MSFQVLDLFSGIGAFSLAFEEAGAEIAAHVEIDKNRQAILARHFLGVPQLGDIRNVQKESFGSPIDLICGGSPCQNLSVAGNRQGLAGTESRLWFEYLRLAQQLKPRWIVWENVPNALASNGGRDFRTILMGLDDCGYHVAWRIFDSQYFGVPQRRRRIFLVGHLGDGRAAQVLFERESLRRTPKTRKETGESSEIAGTLTGNAGGTARPAGNANEKDFIFFGRKRSDDYQESDLSPTLAKRDYKDNSGLLTFSPSVYKRGFGSKLQEKHVSNTLQAGNGRGFSDTDEHIVFKLDHTKGNGKGILEDGTTHSLGGTLDAVSQYEILRRFTPMECERLMGFPDGWTDGFSDSVRYSALGDSIAVPNARWIARRIMTLEAGGEVS